MMPGVTVGFLNWRTERREAAKAGEAHCEEGGDNETNLGRVEFEQFTGPQRESLPFIHFISTYRAHTGARGAAVDHTDKISALMELFVGKICSWKDT